MLDQAVRMIAITLGVVLPVRVERDIPILIFPRRCPEKESGCGDEVNNLRLFGMESLLGPPFGHHMNSRIVLRKRRFNV